MNETNIIIQKIAGVQLKALNKLRDDPEGQVMKHPLISLLMVQYQDIMDHLDQEIELYQSIYDDPINIAKLNPFQVGICSFILFRMELEWILDYPNGVIGAWNKLDISFQMQALIHAN